jgi:predicted secreted protein
MVRAAGVRQMRVTSQKLRVEPGQTFEVTLDEPAATGHRWQLADPGEGIALVDDRYEPPDRTLGLGASGRRVMKLRAAGTGRHVLRFSLARPWEDRPSAEHLVEVDAVKPQ